MNALSFSKEDFLAVRATIQRFGGLSVFVHRFSAKQNSCSWFKKKTYSEPFNKREVFESGTG